MEQILCHTGALRLPVKPQTAGAVMEMIPSDDHVDGRVHLDSADLRARQILTVVDMVDMVILDHGEYAAQMTHDTGLAAVMDIASADDMGADPLLRPAFPLCLTDAVTLCLRTVFEFPFQPLIVVLRLQIFSQRDAAALGKGNITVLDDPSFGPVRPDHAFLISRRRRPLGRGLGHRKAGKRNIADTLLLRIEAVTAHIDLHLLFARVKLLEIGVDDRRILRRILLREPCIDRKVRIPRSHIADRLLHLFESRHLIHGLVVQVHFSGMRDKGSDKPVPADKRGEGIVLPEQAVGHNGLPHTAFHMLPLRYRLRPGDYRRSLFLRTVHDGRLLCSPVSGIYRLSVDTRRHDDLITGLRDPRRLLNCLKRTLPCAVAAVCHGCRYIILHRFFLHSVMISFAFAVLSALFFSLSIMYPIGTVIFLQIRIFFNKIGCKMKNVNPVSRASAAALSGTLSATALFSA